MNTQEIRSTPPGWPEVGTPGYAGLEVLEERLQLVDTQTPPPCRIRGCEMVSILSTQYSYGEKNVIRCLDVPAFRCDDCDYECFSYKGFLGAVRTGADRLEHEGDLATANELRTHAQEYQENLEKRGLLLADEGIL